MSIARPSDTNGKKGSDAMAFPHRDLALTVGDGVRYARMLN